MKQSKSRTKWVNVIAAPLLALAPLAQAQTPPGGLPMPSFADFGDPGDLFGFNITVDGDWMVATNYDREAFYVYQRSGTGWSRRQRIVPPTLGVNFFRTPSLVANRLVLSRPFDVGATPSGSGTIYIYERPAAGVDFALAATIRPSDSQNGDRFGYGLAQSADRVFVGASARDEGANVDQGVVYVFRNTGGNWTEEARLAPADTGAGARFGQDLAYDGQDLLVGAQRHQPTPTTRGAAYVFRLQGGGWTQVQKIVEPGVPGSGTTSFGVELSADAGRAFIHGYGWNSEYLFSRDASGVWGSPQRLDEVATFSGTGFLPNAVSDTDLRGNTLVVTSGSAVTYTPAFIAGPGFAFSFSISNSAPPNRTGFVQLDPDEWGGSIQLATSGSSPSVVIGLPYADASTTAVDQGAIQHHRMNPLTGCGPDCLGIGAALGRIWHGSGNSPDRLGEAIAMDGEWMAVGAAGADAGGVDSGSVHFLQREAGTWQLRQSLSNRRACALGMAGDLAALGECEATADGISGRGKVSVWKRQVSGTWQFLCELTPSTPEARYFGNNIAMSANSIWVSRFNATFQNPGIDTFSSPNPTCASAQALPGPPEFLSQSPSSTAINGAFGVVVQNPLGSSPPTTVPTLRVFEQIAGIWTQTQLIDGPGWTGIFAGSFGNVALDGNRMAAATTVRLPNSIEIRHEVRLYENNGAGYQLARTISAPAGVRYGGLLALRGDTLLLSDDSLGMNSGIAVHRFSTGLREQTLTVSGLTIEDDVPSRLVMSNETDALIGWPLLDRNGANNAGMVYTAQFLTRSTNAWSLAPVQAAPGPDRIFSHFFEDTP